MVKKIAEVYCVMYKLLSNFFHLVKRTSHATWLQVPLHGSYGYICFCLYFFCLFLPFLGTSVIQVTASDADDPTYGNSAKLVYSILEGQPYFSVEAQTGIIDQFIWVGLHNWNALKWMRYIDQGSTVAISTDVFEQSIFHSFLMLVKLFYRLVPWQLVELLGTLH